MLLEKAFLNTAEIRTRWGQMGQIFQGVKDKALSFDDLGKRIQGITTDFKNYGGNYEEFLESVRYIGIRNFIKKYPLTTGGEILRSIFKGLFVKSLQKLIPDIKSEMIIRAPSGVRAQLMNPDGTLEKDFDIKIRGNLIAILNAPSPAATSSLSIASYIFEKIIS